SRGGHPQVSPDTDCGSLRHPRNRRLTGLPRGRALSTASWAPRDCSAANPHTARARSTAQARQSPPAADGCWVCRGASTASSWRRLGASRATAEIPLTCTSRKTFLHPALVSCRAWASTLSLLPPAIPEHSRISCLTRNLLKMCAISPWVCAPKPVRSSSADEHPASLGAALAAAVQYRGHQSALQLAHRSGPARDRRRRAADASLSRRGRGRRGLCDGVPGGVWLRPADGRCAGFLRINWLRVSGTTKMPQVDKRICHRLHAIVPLLDELEPQQQPFEFILPREGPLHA